ncbi:MAG: neutral/alkaline non-lysosomal ceramidase N-terminal domain-containing protein [Chloroflexi bacterium]|nr:neutral/alkaline non-lysosomal ceramidase N-terminal domain-containing protein [Chloroflexota bacterium]
MRAGVAKVCITPPVGVWQGGYGARNRPSEGVHDDLFARALVVEGENGERAALVSVDVVSLTHETADAARRRAEATTGIAAGKIALCTSHTHGGPATRAYGESGPQANDEYVRLLEQYLAGAVAAAARELRSVTVRVGRGQAAFNVNRRVRTPEGTVMRPNPEGVVDREVVVVRLDTADGAAAEAGGPASPTAGPAAPPLAVLFRYTCHATAMGGNNYLITADYPGAAAVVVEQAYGGQTAALFLQGCTGNIRPNLTSADGGFRSATWPELARLGRELGGAVLAAAEHAAFAGDSAVAWEGDTAAAGKTVLLPYGPPPPEAELRTLLDEGRWVDGRPAAEGDRRWAGRALEAIQAGNLEAGAQAEVQVFRLGGVWLVTLPGEVFVEIGWRVRDAVAAATGASPANVVVAAYTNGNVGYVPTAAAMPEGGYEVTVYRRSGRPSGYAPEAEVVLARTAAALAAGLR